MACGMTGADINIHEVFCCGWRALRLNIRKLAGLAWPGSSVSVECRLHSCWPTAAPRRAPIFDTPPRLLASGRLVAILSPPPYDIRRRFFQQRSVCLARPGEHIAVKQTYHSRLGFGNWLEPRRSRCWESMLERLSTLATSSTA